MEIAVIIFGLDTATANNLGNGASDQWMDTLNRQIQSQVFYGDKVLGTFRFSLVAI